MSSPKKKNTTKKPVKKEEEDDTGGWFGNRNPLFSSLLTGDDDDNEEQKKDKGGSKKHNSSKHKKEESNGGWGNLFSMDNAEPVKGSGTGDGGGLFTSFFNDDANNKSENNATEKEETKKSTSQHHDITSNNGKTSSKKLDSNQKDKIVKEEVQLSPSLPVDDNNKEKEATAKKNTRKKKKNNDGTTIGRKKKKKQVEKLFDMSEFKNYDFADRLKNDVIDALEGKDPIMQKRRNTIGEPLRPGIYFEGEGPFEDKPAWLKPYVMRNGKKQPNLAFISWSCKRYLTQIPTPWKETLAYKQRRRDLPKPRPIQHNVGSGSDWPAVIGLRPWQRGWEEIDPRPNTDPVRVEDYYSSSDDEEYYNEYLQSIYGEDWESKLSKVARKAQHDKKKIKEHRRKILAEKNAQQQGIFGFGGTTNDDDDGKSVNTEGDQSQLSDQKRKEQIIQERLAKKMKEKKKKEEEERKAREKTMMLRGGPSRLSARDTKILRKFEELLIVGIPILLVQKKNSTAKRFLYIDNLGRFIHYRKPKNCKEGKRNPFPCDISCSTAKPPIPLGQLIQIKGAKTKDGRLLLRICMTDSADNIDIQAKDAEEFELFMEGLTLLYVQYGNGQARDIIAEQKKNAEIRKANRKAKIKIKKKKPPPTPYKPFAFKYEVEGKEVTVQLLGGLSLEDVILAIIAYCGFIFFILGFFCANLQMGIASSTRDNDTLNYCYAMGCLVFWCLIFYLELDSDYLRLMNYRKKINDRRIAIRHNWPIV